MHSIIFLVRFWPLIRRYGIEKDVAVGVVVVVAFVKVIARVTEVPRAKSGVRDSRLQRVYI